MANQRINVEDMIMEEKCQPDFDSITAAGHSHQSRDLVEKLLIKDKKTRPAVATALRHPWFNMNLDTANRSAGDMGDHNEFGMDGGKAPKRAGGNIM